MSRKVIIDCDMGIDDAVALCMLLFDRRLDVIGVTAVEGCVTAAQANNNLQAIVSEIDPERYPRLGMATPAENAPAVDTRYLFGEDGLGNANFDASLRQHLVPADKLIADLVRANPGQVTLLCLGPMTNLARAMRRDPTLAGSVDQIIVTGGSLTADGNVTPCAEFNLYFDPFSAREVFQSRTTLTLVPLDITKQVKFGLDTLELVPCDSSRTGYFLRQILPHAFRAFRQQLGQEAITLNDAVGGLFLLEPQLFKSVPMACDVETEAELTRGVMVIDRRMPGEWRPNVNVLTEVEPEQARQYIVDLLTMSGNASK
ncbi:MAG: nucleoside hydrolase [Planctomycetota bacterium]